MALAPLPDKRFRIDVRKPREIGVREPLVPGCPCTACADYDRDYLNYISKSEELTAVRLLVDHNLTYMERLMRGAREAIAAGQYGDYSEKILAGTAPWDAR
jgi:tRNA-guanine family transglycosylase